MHSFSYNSHNLDLRGSNILVLTTGLLVILISHTLVVKKSLVKTYFPFLLKQASEIELTISVKKFLDPAS